MIAFDDACVFDPVGKGSLSKATNRARWNASVTGFTGEAGKVTGAMLSTGHTLACAAGVAVQRIVRRDNLLEKVRENGILLKRGVSHS